MTSQRHGGFSDELLESNHKGIVACLSLRYKDYEHSFVHTVSLKKMSTLSSVRFAVVSSTVCNAKPGTIELITAFITS